LLIQAIYETMMSRLAYLHLTLQFIFLNFFGLIGFFVKSKVRKVILVVCLEKSGGCHRSSLFSITHWQQFQRNNGSIHILVGRKKMIKLYSNVLVL